MAASLYRRMAAQIGHEYERARAKKLFRNLLDLSATVQITDIEVRVTLDKNAHSPSPVIADHLGAGGGADAHAQVWWRPIFSGSSFAPPFHDRN